MTSVKFNYNATAQALYEVASDCADESLGNCDYGWMALFLVYDEWTIKAADWSAGEDLVIAAGTFTVIEEATSESVGITTFPNDTDAQEYFDKFAYHFAIWEEANGY